MHTPRATPRSQTRGDRRLRTIRKLAVSIGLTVLASASAGCGGGGAAAHDLGGTLKVEIYDQSVNQIPEGGRCSMGPRFAEGSQVVVQDGAGAVLAVGSLSGGAAVEPLGYGVGLAKYCSFDVSVEDVPPSAVYQVVVADRVAFTGSADQLDAIGWTLDAAITPR